MFDELQLGKANLFRKFSYTDGAATQKHLDEGAVLSKPTTTLVSKIEYADGRTIEYEYDEEERITKVIDSFDGITEYEYDALGKLKTETVNGTVVNNMTYDNYGNIAEKNGVVYQYGNAVWKDLLTQVGTGANSTITYDANGNPTTYLGHTLTWEKGRQLKKFDNIEYTYNANGIKTSKKVNGVCHSYTLDGTKILRETWGEDTLVPLYDNGDSVCGILYNSVPYYFIKNLQGDVIAIVDKTAQTVARYSYDAWGVPTIKEDTSSCSIATITPFRYRGYYYDVDTGLYYLRSRYYNAALGRFVNSDEPGMLALSKRINTANLYQYSCNLPTVLRDDTGLLPMIAIPAFVGVYGSSLSGAALAAKLMAYIAVFLPYVVFGIAIIFAIAVAAYLAYQSYLTSTKKLSTVQPRTTNSKVFKLAYATKDSLVTVGKSLSFVEALTILGVKKATCSLRQRYKVTAKSPFPNNTNWGMYTTSQAYACALATMLACDTKPEVHGSGFYGHYHDKERVIHIWFGYPIIYR